MNASEIFKNLCDFRSQKGGMSPYELEKSGVEVKDMSSSEIQSDDLISCKRYIGEDGKEVQEMISSYDHSRTCELRPDTNHFIITNLDTGESRKFMTKDDDL